MAESSIRSPLAKFDISIFDPMKHLQIANPASFLAQKILIRGERDTKARAKDILYIHDTIVVFSGYFEGPLWLHDALRVSWLSPLSLSDSELDGLAFRIGRQYTAK
ncbi:MAG: hypothetical protein WCA19_17900 [Candidatus Acidiferrales bacterium]